MSFKLKISSADRDLQKDIHLLKVLSSLNTADSSSREFIQAQKIIKAELEELNLTVHEYFSPLHGPHPVLMAENKVERPFVEVSLISHLDTVLAPRELQFKKGEIWGSGVADNKGGVVCGLRFLKHIRALPGVKVRFVCSPSEESGSLGFHELFQKWGQTSDFVFGLEPAQQGALIEKRNGNRWYQVQVQGVSSHAGRMNEPCVNAAHEACHKISALSSLNNLAQYTRVNIGHLEGGDGLFNRTCERVNFKLDTRFPSFEIRERLHAELESIFSQHGEVCQKTGRRPFCFYSIEDDCPPMDTNKKYHFLTKKIQEVFRFVEKSPVELVHSGGAADINYFSHAHNYCLDGLGPVGAGIHTHHEMIQASSLKTRPLALAKFFHEWIYERHTQGVFYESATTQPESLEF